jgi:hypothetical protein
MRSCAGTDKHWANIEVHSKMKVQRLAISGLAALAGVLGPLLMSADALAAGNAIRLSGPSSVNYGASIKYTVSGHAHRVRGAYHDYPPNYVIVDVLTSPSPRCPSGQGRASQGNLREVLRFQSHNVSQVISPFSRTLTVKADGHAYGLCAFLLNFPFGHKYALAAAYWTVRGHAPGPYTLTVSIVPNSLGEGSVISASDYSEAIDCDPWSDYNICSHTYPAGTTVTLSPNDPDRTSFASWSGACSGTQPECQVTIDANKSVTATFNDG